MIIENEQNKRTRTSWKKRLSVFHLYVKNCFQSDNRKKINVGGEEGEGRKGREEEGRGEERRGEDKRGEER